MNSFNFFYILYNSFLLQMSKLFSLKYFSKLFLLNFQIFFLHLIITLSFLKPWDFLFYYFFLYFLIRFLIFSTFSFYYYIFIFSMTKIKNYFVISIFYKIIEKYKQKQKKIWEKQIQKIMK